MNAQSKKDRLIDSAATLFHRNGMLATSLADIAKHAEIPIGNVYYYFKTKDELALAAILKRKDQFSTLYNLLSENLADPRERLIETVNYYNNSRDDYARYGCPIGKIISDTDAEKDLVSETASSIFSDFVGWASAQFQLLGHNEIEASKYAISLMSGIQGAILMAKSFGQPIILTTETGRLVEWLQAVPNRNIRLGKVHG